MIIVTGGAGFIGSNIVAALNDARIDVVVCDRLRDTDKWRNLSKRVLQALIAPQNLFAYLEREKPSVEAIVHMGAISATTVTDGDLVAETNFELSRALWRWCTEHNVPFIYASSAATYGNGEQGFNDAHTAEHLATLRPLNLYGWSKHLFDQFVASTLEHGRPTPPQFAGLKFFNVYGPNEQHKGSMKSVVAHLFPSVRDGHPAKLFRSYHDDYADGGQLRDFVYVRDCAAVVTWLLNNPSVSGVFNVGTGQARSFADLAAVTMHAAGHEPAIDFIDMPELLKDKYQYYTCADMERLRRAGYNAPFTELSQGVYEYVTQFLLNPDPYR
jgi:ADP-L-glycero-D-manno-heptose 6-epimerase